MNVQAWLTLLSVVVAAGALIFTARQVRLNTVQVQQTTRATRAATTQATAAAGGGIAQLVATDADVAHFYRIGSEDLSQLDAEQLVRFSALLVHIFRNFESVYSRYDEGSLDHSSWVGWQNVITWYFWKPGVQSWWPTRKDTFKPSFVKFLETSERPSITDRKF
jgi:hypothetical protein